MNNKTILFFGGSGSLGNEFINNYSNLNKIINFSRDECKHWKMEMKFNNISNIIGDIRNKERVKQSIKKVNPHIIIIASALKHIDRCEFASGECISTNILGIQNILNCINELENLQCETVVFISTDKACNPVNLYGMCKAASEKMMIESAKNSCGIKYVNVRYGNVLNSRGSIIPFLHNQGKDTTRTHFTLTDKRMTRFIMTLKESCDLIEYAILHGTNGQTIIPSIKSMYIKDIFDIFSELYNKPIKVIGLRPGEKLYESLINGTQHLLTYKKNGYYHITPPYDKKLLNTEQLDINSNYNLLTKEELKTLLVKLKLIDIPKKHNIKNDKIGLAYELGC